MIPINIDIAALRDFMMAQQPDHSFKICMSTDPLICGLPHIEIRIAKKLYGITYYKERIVSYNTLDVVNDPTGFLLAIMESMINDLREDLKPLEER